MTRHQWGHFCVLSSRGEMINVGCFLRLHMSLDMKILKKCLKHGRSTWANFKEPVFLQNHLSWSKITMPSYKSVTRVDFEGKNILEGNTWQKYILHWKKYPSWRIMLEKILHRYLSQEVCDKKNSYAKKDHSYPPPPHKRQMVDP